MPVNDAARWQAWSDTVCQQLSITVEERDFFPAGVAAWANWTTRTIVVPPLSPCLREDILLVRVAVRAHEIGHIQQGPCPDVAPHYKDPAAAATGWHSCLLCETDAWDRGLRILPPLTLTREMHKRLQTSLANYRRKTPAHREAKDAARQLASDSTFARVVQARADRERRLDAFAEMSAAAADARRPQPLKYWERQWRDIQQWSREARG